jgi:hypothetical protein
MSQEHRATLMLEMLRQDDPSLTGPQVGAMAQRILDRPGNPRACVHRMPQGMSAFRDGQCVRCGSRTAARV